MKNKEKKRREIQATLMCFATMGLTMTMLFFAAVKALDEGYTPTEEYSETCIRPTIEHVEAAESEKQAVAEIATTTEFAKQTHEQIGKADFSTEKPSETVYSDVGFANSTEKPSETVYSAAHIPLPVPKIEEIETTVLDNTPTVRYSLTTEERTEIERVVMAECGAEPYEGIIAVAQCILNACEKSGKRPHEAIRAYGYTPNRKTPSETVRKAVSEVFDNGKEIVEEYILYFYAPSWGNGTWHETMNFVVEIGGHRFFSDPVITK